MRNTPFEELPSEDLRRENQLRRVQRVMEAELTDKQRSTLKAYYLEGLRPAEIARRQGVHPSTVLRCIRRAENKLRRYLMY